MHNIRPKIMLASGIVVVGLLSVVLIGSFQVYRQSIQRVIEESVQKTAEESAWHLTNMISGYIAPLEDMAKHEDIRSMDIERQKNLIQSQINPNYENIAVVDLAGQAYYLDGDVIDLSDRDYIQQALRGEQSISELLISRKTGEKVILAAIPIREGEEVVGAIMARLDMSLLRKYLATRGYDQEGEVYIISQEGSTILLPVQEDVLSVDSLFSMGEDINSEYYSFATMAERNLLVPSGLDRYQHAGSEYVVYFASIEGTNWKVYVSASEDMLLLRIRNVMLFLTLGAVAVFCLILAVIWFLVKRYTKPILELESLMEQGAKGDFTVHFSEKIDDEIGRLGDGFNKLIKTIKELTYFDPVTGQLNRYVLKNDVQNRMINKEDKFAIVMIQIDGFQEMNDALGYDASDQVLQETGRWISRIALAMGTVYRYKGDAFAVLIPEENYRKNRFATIMGRKSTNESPRCWF